MQVLNVETDELITVGGYSASETPQHILRAYLSGRFGIPPSEQQLAVPAGMWKVTLNAGTEVMSSYFGCTDQTVIELSRVRPRGDGSPTGDGDGTDPSDRIRSHQSKVLEQQQQQFNGSSGSAAIARIRCREDLLALFPARKGLERT